MQERHISIFCDYIFDDGVTLESVGNRYNISRERVRQIVAKYRKRLKGAFYKSEFKSYSIAINDVFLNVSDKAFVHFIAFAFLPQSGKRLTAFLLQCLFGTDVAEAVIAVAQSLIFSVEPLNKHNEKITGLLSKAIFPGLATEYAHINNIECGESKESFYKDNLLIKLSQCKDIKGIVRNPKIVYCVTSATTHIPDFCLQTKDDKLILVIDLPTLNMAIYYNLNRFRALHRFCKENGYGYLIIDDRYNTIFDIRNSEIDKELSEALLQVLNKTGRIVWHDIQRLKSKFNISDSILAAFVIQNKLKFTLDPYVISYYDKKSDMNNQDTLSEIKDDGVSLSLQQTLGEEQIEEAGDTQNYVSTRIGKYDFICDENGEILTDIELFDEFRKLRLSIAKAENVSAFLIFWDSALISLATYKPTNEEEWLAIKGLGAAKFAKYGEQFIKLIKEHCKD